MVVNFHRIVTVQISPVESRHVHGLILDSECGYRGRMRRRLRMHVARRQLGWTQRRLSIASRVPVGDISRIESGRYQRQVERLARTLKLTPAELLEEVEVLRGPGAF